MPKPEHRTTCPASEGGVSCTCGVVHTEIYGREALASSILQTAQSLQQNWKHVPDRIRRMLSDALPSQVVLLHDDIEKLCRLIEEFKKLD